KTILLHVPGVDHRSFIEVENGTAAVAAVRSERPDLVVMDVMMPWLDGFQATRLIKDEWPATKIILVTSVVDKAYERAAHDAGADAFVNKRAITTQLAPTVERLVSGADSGSTR